MIYQLSHNSQNVIHKIIVALITFICIGHVYSPLYLSGFPNIFYVLLLISIAIYLSRLRLQRSVFVFLLPFLLCVSLLCVSQGNYGQILKYLIYTLWCAALTSYADKNSWIYDYVLAVTAFAVTLSLILYFVLMLDIGLRSSMSGNFHDTSIFSLRKDWDYAHFLYVFVHPMNEVPNGVTGLERFYGASPEPTLNSIMLLVMMHIAILKLRRGTSLFMSIAIFISSSYAVLLSWITLKIIKLRKLLLLLVLSLLALNMKFILNLIIDAFGSNRMTIYFSQIDRVFGFKLIGPSSAFENQDYFSMPMGIFNVAHQYGFILIIFYLISLSIFIRLLVIRNYCYGEILAISIIIFTLNKSGEPVSLLFLFYASFLINNKKEPISFGTVNYAA